MRRARHMNNSMLCLTGSKLTANHYGFSSTTKIHFNSIVNNKDKLPRCWKWTRNATFITAICGVAYIGADWATDSSITRSLRSLVAFSRIAYLYKFTTPSTVEEYKALHRHAAETLLNVCLRNEGLYIKIGQVLHAMSHVLPQEYVNALRVLLDNAPPVPLEEIRRIILEETGRSLEELFIEFDPKPVASASIAQVHRARLRHPESLSQMQSAHKEMNKQQQSNNYNKDNNNNTSKNNALGICNDSVNCTCAEVAVKVQKPYIRTQSKWDLRTYTLISILVEKLFKLPTAWSRHSIVDGLTREMDFTIEAHNAQKMRDNFANSTRVYVPYVCSTYTTSRLLIMEWIDATKLSEVDTVKNEFNAPAILKVLFDAFGDMVFKHGFVHCDPHPANILVRHSPDLLAAQSGNATLKQDSVSSNTTPSLVKRKKRSKHDFQLVLIDFGLCVPETERFRMEYALLFKSLFTRDMQTVREIIHDWGISDAETFASMQLQKPLESIQSGNYGEVTKEEVIAMQSAARNRMRKLLLNEARIPRELPLVGRGVDILRGVNRMYGSPVNRVNMFVSSAIECLGPLHDMNGVKRYLELLRARTEKQNTYTNSNSEKSIRSNISRHSSAKEKDSDQVHEQVEGQTTLASSNHNDRDVQENFYSVFDENADAFRAAQALALKEIQEEQKRSLKHTFLSSFQSTYRKFLFKATLLYFNFVHHFSRIYNSLLSLSIVPRKLTEKYHAKTLEERIESMKDVIRVE